MERAFEGSEAVFKGISGCGGSVVIGRVCISENGREARRGGAVILCMFERLTEGELEGYVGELSPAGVILSAAAISPRLLETVIGKGIPYLILKDGFCRGYDGRVAMLDTERDMIVINPGLDAIGLYSRGCLDIEALPLRAKENYPDYMLFDCKSGGVMIDADALPDRSDVCSTLMETAERFCGEHVSVMLSVPLSYGDREVFRNTVEAIYRAAVYGSFSVYLRGYRGEEDIGKALLDMHRVFCRLEEEGREFNGYLRRGIVIDAPVWLLRPSPFIKADAVCYDVDAVVARLVGCEARELSGRELETDALLRIWEQYFSRFATECRRIALCRRVKGRLLHRIEAMSGIEEIYSIAEVCKEENT